MQILNFSCSVMECKNIQQWIVKNSSIIQFSLWVPLPCQFGISYGMHELWNYYHTQWTVEGSVFGAISLCFFCLCMKYLGNRWTDLRQIHMEDVFGPSLGRVWRSRSPGTKRHFSALSCVQFMFGETSLVSSLKECLSLCFIRSICRQDCPGSH